MNAPARGSAPAGGGSLDHVIFTRFNLPTVGAESTVRAQEGWLRNRVELFLRYTVPSMRAQTVSDWTWVIYFDSDSPDWLLERLRPLVDDGVFIPLYRQEVGWADVAADARTVTGAHSSVLLTTNLDNDDAVAADFIERLQQLARIRPHHALFLRDGLIQAGDRLYLRRDRDNAFCSVSEPWDAPQTAWRDWHILLRTHFPAVNHAGTPAWLQVVHGQNVSNGVHGRLVDPTPYRELFPGLLDDVPVPSVADRRRDAWISHPLREGRAGARRLAKGAYLKLFGKGSLDRLKGRLVGTRA